MPSGTKVCRSSAESTNVTLDTAHGNVNEFHRNSLVTIDLLKRLTPNQTKEIFAHEKNRRAELRFFLSWFSFRLRWVYHQNPTTVDF